MVDLIGELGQHPTIIEKSIAQSNSQKQKSLRPLKKKLAELNKRHGEISAQLRRYLELAGKGDRHFSFEIRAEAEKLAADKHAVEIERDKVRIEIDYKERVVTDHQVIAERLRHFKDTFDALPYEDQKEALRLILKSICIKKFDPENDRLPSGKPFTTLQIRTSLYLVQLEFIANDLIPTTYKGGGESSTFVPYGRDDWIRTSDLCVPNAALCQTELHPVIFGIKIKQTHFQNARSLLSRPTGPSLSSCPSPRSSEKPL